tara:strand:- start:83 stop:1525 length:1443 start_codon:yes stop_codon:yes gene_type:complete
MSLPVVSYGRYNYGQYSNPTPIRFTGGFGAGIAQGITAGVKEIVRQTQEKQKKEDAANLASAKAQIQFQAATDAYLKSATEENKAFLIQQKQFRGETERLFALKQISLDDYTKRVSASQGLLSQLKQLNGLITDLGEINNGEEILDSELRNNPTAFDANIKLEALRKGAFKITGDYENGFNIELPMYQSAMGAGEEIKEYAVGEIPLTQLLQNPKLYTPTIKYEHGANAKMKQLSGVIEQLARKKGLTKEVSDGDNINVIIDPDKKQELIDLVKQEGSFAAALTKKEREQLFEDNIFKLDNKGNLTENLNGLGSFKNSTEQNQLVDNRIIEDIIKVVEGNIVSTRRVSSDKSERKTNFQNLANALNAINKKLTKGYGTIIGSGIGAGIKNINSKDVLNEYNTILGDDGGIIESKDEDNKPNGKFFLIGSDQSKLNTIAFRKEVKMKTPADLEDLKRKVAIFLKGVDMLPYVGGSELPQNK